MPDKSVNNTPQTTGLEFEGVTVTKEVMDYQIKRDPILSRTIRCVTRDASVESKAITTKNGVTIFTGNNLIRNAGISDTYNIVLGYEAVTEPLEIDTIRSTIKAMTALQHRLGDIYSPRSSVHVHVGFPNGLIFLKGAVRLGEKVEPLMYKLAGMTREFRGLKNDSAYCRSLSNPPAIRLSDRRGAAILNMGQAKSAKTIDEFWASFGISTSERNRYTPLRYLAINVFSILLRGTLEWRFFGYSDVAAHTEAVTSLCRYVSELMIKLPLDTINSIPQLNLFSENHDGDYIDLLNALVKLGRRYRTQLNISVDDYYNLIFLIENTPQPILSSKPTLTHLKEYEMSFGRATSYGLNFVEEAKYPDIVDIHTFEKTERILGE